MRLREFLGEVATIKRLFPEFIFRLLFETWHFWVYFGFLKIYYSKYSTERQVI